MGKTLTITLPEDVYEGLRRRAGSEDISRYIEELLRPLVLNDTALDAAYAEMASDASREQAALEWIEAAPDDARRGAKAPAPELLRWRASCCVSASRGDAR